MPKMATSAAVDFRASSATRSPGRQPASLRSRASFVDCASSSAYVRRFPSHTTAVASERSCACSVTQCCRSLCIRILKSRRGGPVHMIPESLRSAVENSQEKPRELHCRGRTEYVELRDEDDRVVSHCVSARQRERAIRRMPPCMSDQRSALSVSADG